MEFQMKEVGFATELPFGSLQVAGNEEYGFRPYQLMVASVAVCSGGVLKQILEKMRLSFEDIKIQTNLERNEKEANRIEKIYIHFLIKGNDLKEDQIQKALELTKKNCSMVQSVIGSIEVIETFELI
jgi:putative redox protein